MRRNKNVRVRIFCHVLLFWGCLILKALLKYIYSLFFKNCKGQIYGWGEIYGRSLEGIIKNERVWRYFLATVFFKSAF